LASDGALTRNRYCFALRWDKGQLCRFMNRNINNHLNLSIRPVAHTFFTAVEFDKITCNRQRHIRMIRSHRDDVFNQITRCKSSLNLYIRQFIPGIMDTN